MVAQGSVSSKSRAVGPANACNGLPGGGFKRPKTPSGTKHDQSKPDFWLLPWPEIESVVRVLTFGAKKYKPENWRFVKRGEERYFSAACRHLTAIRCGEKLDKETGAHHYAHAICSLLFAFWHARKK